MDRVLLLSYLVCLAVLGPLDARAADPAAEALAAVREGHALLEKRRPAEACQAFRRAAELLPAWWIPHYERARCGRLVGDSYEDLLREIQAAAAAAPQSGVVHQLTGFIHEDAGKLDEAAASYRIAVRLDPELRDGRLRLAALELRAKRAPEARTLFEEVIERWPRSVQALSGLAEACERMGDRACTERALLRLTVVSSYPAQIYARLVALYRAAGLEKAEAAAERAWRTAAEGRPVEPPLAPALSDGTR